MNLKIKKSIAFLTAFFISSLLVLVDQMTKSFAVDYFKESEKIANNNEIILIKNVFRLTYLENDGIAWGLLPSMRMFFVVLTIGLLLGIAYYYWKLPLSKRYIPIRIVIVLLTAGAFGNMIDRIRQGYVVDFFEFLFISFPVFNMADVYVSTSAAFLLILILFVYKEEDLTIFLSKKKRMKRESGRDA